VGLNDGVLVVGIDVGVFDGCLVMARTQPEHVNLQFIWVIGSSVLQ
jgi:hypothetical protein